MSKTLHAIILFLLSFCGYSQQVMITGKVEIDNVDEPMNLSTIIIENLSTFSKTKANDGGIFSIKASEGDILQFTSGFTTERNIKITSPILSKGFIQVHLDLEVIELAEANLNTLKKNLKDNISKEDTKQTNFYKSLGLDPNLQYIEVNPNVTSSINNNGIVDPTLWISALTGQHKKDIQKDEYFKKENHVKKVIEFFTTDYFIDRLKIPAHKINEFIHFCYAQKNINLKQLIETHRMEEVEDHLLTQAEIYIELLNKTINK